MNHASAFPRDSTLDYPDRKPYFAEFHVPSLDPDIPVEPS